MQAALIEILIDEGTCKNRNAAAPVAERLADWFEDKLEERLEEEAPEYVEEALPGAILLSRGKETQFEQYYEPAVELNDVRALLQVALRDSLKRDVTVVTVDVERMEIVIRWPEVENEDIKYKRIRLKG